MSMKGKCVTMLSVLHVRVYRNRIHSIGLFNIVVFDITHSNVLRPILFFFRIGKCVTILSIFTLVIVQVPDMDTLVTKSVFSLFY